MWETKFVIIYSYRNEIKELVQLFRWWGEDKTIGCPPFFMAQNTMANSTNIIKWWRRNISITQGWIQMEMSTSGWRVCHTLACRSIVRPSAPIILTKCRSIYFVLLFSWKEMHILPFRHQLLHVCSIPVPLHIYLDHVSIRVNTPGQYNAEVLNGRLMEKKRREDVRRGKGASILQSFRRLSPSPSSCVCPDET